MSSSDHRLSNSVTKFNEFYLNSTHHSDSTLRFMIFTPKHWVSKVICWSLRLWRPTAIVGSILWIQYLEHFWGFNNDQIRFRVQRTFSSVRSHSTFSVWQWLAAVASRTTANSSCFLLSFFSSFQFQAHFVWHHVKEGLQAIKQKWGFLLLQEYKWK